MRGDLAAAQQVLAALWVTLSEAKGALSSGVPPEKVAEMIAGARKECAELYARAFGD